MQKSSKRPVLFLDRDGTINVDIGPEYISRPEQLKLIPGVAKAIVAAVKAGFGVAVLTNQAGVAKGKTPAEALPIVHRHLEKLVASEAGLSDFRFDDLRVCMHHPNDRCQCRKPETHMLEESIMMLGADVARSFFVGDKMSDLQCATRVGMRSILVLTGHGRETEAECREPDAKAKPAGVVPTLTEAVSLATELLKSSR